ERGENLPLSRAWRMAADHDIAVELHCNAFGRPSATGVKTLSQPEHMELNQTIYTAINNTLNIVNRGAKDEGSDQHSHLTFVNSDDEIIVELFFINNPDDVAKYQRWKLQLAEVLADLLAEEVCNA